MNLPITDYLKSQGSPYLKYISIAWLIKKLYDFQLNTKNFNSFV